MYTKPLRNFGTLRSDYCSDIRLIHRCLCWPNINDENDTQQLNLAWPTESRT